MYVPNPMTVFRFNFIIRGVAKREVPASHALLLKFIRGAKNYFALGGDPTLWYELREESLEQGRRLGLLGGAAAPPNAVCPTP